MGYRHYLCGAVAFALMASVAHAQDRAHTAWLNTSRWLERNYREADVQTTISTRQMQRLLEAQDGLLGQLDDLQHETAVLIRHARDSENLQAAADAVRESRANTMSMGALSGRLGPSRETSDLYLLAFQDHTIRAALAYWAEGGTLHYLGTDREQHEAPVDSLDRALTVRLNRERGVDFRLDETPPQR